MGVERKRLLPMEIDRTTSPHLEFSTILRATRNVQRTVGTGTFTNPFIRAPVTWVLGGREYFGFLHARGNTTQKLLDISVSALVAPLISINLSM